MGRKRRTKQDKVIAKLRRQLKTTTVFTPSTSEKESQTASPIKLPSKKTKIESFDNQLSSFDPKLIKRDLKKTAFLSLAFIGVIFLLFLFFEKGGEKILGSLLG